MTEPLREFIWFIWCMQTELTRFCMGAQPVPKQLSTVIHEREISHTSVMHAITATCDSTYRVDLCIRACSSRGILQLACCQLLVVATGICRTELTVCLVLCLCRKCPVNYLAQQIFTQVGEKLQRRRLKDFYQNFGSHLTDEYQYALMLYIVDLFWFWLKVDRTLISFSTLKCRMPHYWQLSIGIQLFG